MDFLLKKIVSMLLMPLPLGVAIIIVGILFLYKNHIKQAKYLFISSVVWFFSFSYPPFVNPLLHQLESSYPTLHTPPQNIHYIYVLGGGHHTDNTQPITSQINASSVVRLTEGIRLYNRLQKDTKLILSGYSGLNDPTSHAQMQTKLAYALGIDREHIIMQPLPKDTQDEAKAAKSLLGDTPFILVTSAYHMKRAMHLFEKEGLHPIAAPTNHLATLAYPDYYNIFSSKTLKYSRIIFHESLGLLWQTIKGL